MKGAVLEKLHEAKAQVRRKRGILGLIHIAALLEMKGELDLSDDQMKKLLSIRSDMIRTKAKLSGDIRIARLEMVYSIAGSIGNINADQVRSSLQNIYALRVERKAATIEAFRKASDVLTAEQKDKFKESVAARLSEYEAQEAEYSPEID